MYLLVLSTYISLCSGLSTLLLIKINGSNRVHTNLSRGTDKSFSDALILASTNPHCDKRLSIEV